MIWPVKIEFNWKFWFFQPIEWDQSHTNHIPKWILWSVLGFLSLRVSFSILSESPSCHRPSWIPIHDWFVSFYFHISCFFNSSFLVFACFLSHFFYFSLSNPFSMCNYFSLIFRSYPGVGSLYDCSLRRRPSLISLSVCILWDLLPWWKKIWSLYMPASHCLKMKKLPLYRRGSIWITWCFFQFDWQDPCSPCYRLRSNCNPL